jgi:hypothetical protein
LCVLCIYATAVQSLAHFLTRLEERK